MNSMKGAQPSARYWTMPKIATAFVVSFGKMIQLLCCLGLAPFYPGEAMERGNVSIQVGLVFGIYPLVGFFCSPLVGKLLAKGYRVKRILCFGLLTDCFFMTIFSMLYKIRDSTWFFVGSVICRGIQSIGVTMSSVTYYGIAAANFPDKMSIFIPIIETMSGFGVMIGPTLGGILHQMGGFSAPFLLFAGMTFVFMIITLFVLPSVQMSGPSAVEENSSLSLKKIVSDARVLVDVSMVFAGFIAISFNDATLAILLDRFGLNSAYKGAAFLVSALCYSVSSILYGKIGKQMKDVRVIAIFGGLCLIVAFSFMSPIPIFNFSSSLTVVLVCQALLGTGAAAFYICCYSHGYYHLTQTKGLPDDYRTYSLMAGIIQSSFFLGSLAGATGGGILLQYFGYSWTTLIIVVTIVLLTVAVSLALIVDKAHPPARQLVADCGPQIELEKVECRSNGNDVHRL